MDKKEKEFFVQAVYDVVRIIPYGRVTSYGAIAKAIGHSNMSRMVGRVMSDCKACPENIPAHRVVNSHGKLSGKDAFGCAAEMQKLLETEGVIVVGDKIKKFEILFWDPLQEI